MKDLTKHSILFFTLLLFFVSGSLLPVSIGHALPVVQSLASDETNIKCYSLDVVFLIDQSGSMIRRTESGGPNDPSGLRKSAVDWVINWLGDNVLSYCPDAIHRIAVISWGDKAETDLVDNISPRTIQEWSLSRDNLKAQVIFHDFPYTQPVVAFEEAQDILTEFASLPLGDLPRKRLIIFVTDGVPAFAGIDVAKYSNDLTNKVRLMFPFDTELLLQEKCLTEALEQAKKAGKITLSPEDKNNCLGNYKVNENAYGNSTYIWSILLNANDGVPYKNYVSFYNAMDTIAQEHAGYVTAITQSIDIPATFLDIMTSVAGVRAEKLGCQSFAMEPYLQQATLSFFKIDKDIAVEISYQDGDQTYTITQDDLKNNTTWPLELPGFIVKDYTSDNTIERYVFLRPHAGYWNIRAPITSDCKGIQAFFEPLDFAAEQLSPSSTVPQYDLEPYYDQSSPVYIEYRLINRESPLEIIEPDPQYPLTITATLKGPGSESQMDLAMVYDHERESYRSQVPLNVSVVGKYEFSVRAETTYVDTKISGKRILFVDGPRFFEVTPVTPFKILISEPQPKQVYSLHGGPKTSFSIKPIEFRVVLTDRNGNKIEPSQVFLDLNSALQGEVTSSDGEKVEVSFAPDPNRPDEFIGQVTSLRDEGNYHLSVSVKDEEAYVAQYRPDNKIVETDFILRDTLWTRPLTYKVLGIILLMFIIACIIVTALNRNNPVTGTLVFEIGDTHIADIPIGTGWNVTKVSRRTLQAYPSLGLKSLKAYKSKEQLGCVDYSAIDMNRNPYSGTLMPESTTPFAGGITVRYEPLESQ